MLELASRFLKIGTKCYRAAACLFTVTPDGDFVIDFHPDHPELIVASACSGHGFKFAPVLGQHLIELLDGNCEPELEFLRVANRLAKSNP